MFEANRGLFKRATLKSCSFLIDTISRKCYTTVDKEYIMEEKELRDLVAKADTFDKTKDISLALVNKYNLPTTPTGDKVEEDLAEAIDSNKMPDTKEQKKLKKRIKNIWGRYRDNVLGQLDLKNYQDYCDLEIKTAETEQKLRQIQMDREKAEADHWLKMHEGNLKEIGYNTESMPSRFFYSLDRFIFYLKNGFNNIPKMVWKLLLGLIGTGIGIAFIIWIAKII